MNRTIRCLMITMLMLSALLFFVPESKAASLNWPKLYADYIDQMIEEGTAVALQTQNGNLTTPPNAVSTDAAESDADGEGPSPSPSPEPEYADLGLRGFFTFADLDRDGVPELLYGYNDALDAEIRVQVLYIQNNKVYKAEGPQITAAYSLKSIRLVLYRTNKGYVWMLQSGGHEKPNGRRQIRHTQLSFKDGQIKSAHRFTKRWTSTDEEFYVDGEQVSSKTYKTKYKQYQNSVKAIGRVPVVSMGSSDKAPAPERIRATLQEVTEKYRQFAAPQKMKLKGKTNKLTLGQKSQAKLLIAPAYASATRATPVWTSSDLGVATVDEKGRVRTVGFGEVVITATLPDGSSASARLTVVRPKVTKVAIKAESKKLRDGEQMQLFYRVSPATARADVIWKSNDPSVIQVDEKTGLVTAMKPGKARVGCWVNKKIKTGIDLTVTTGVMPTGVTMSATERELDVGERFVLNASVVPENATIKLLNWSSSNPRVASVSENGVVIAHAPGTASIYALSPWAGSRATCQVTVRDQESRQRADIPEGVYKILLSGSDRALSVKGYSAVQRKPLSLEADVDGANQRFVISRIESGVYELRPLSAPKTYLCMVPDPLTPSGGTRLALMLEPSEQQRRFTVTRMSGGSYAFSLASNPAASFGASGDTDGADVRYVDGAESETLRQFRLMLMSQPGMLEPIQTPASTPDESAQPTQDPSPEATVIGPAARELDWIRNLTTILENHQTELSAWSHVQLCDLDWSGVPELVVFTDQRSKAIQKSLTARQGLIFSPELSAGMVSIFEYEPGPNEDLSDERPALRLLVDGATNERRWVLCDGETGSASSGALRYVLIKYSQGVCGMESLFERSWRAAGSGKSQTYEIYSAHGEEISNYQYGQEFNKYFEGSIWGNSVKALVNCTNRPLEQVIAELKQLIGSRKWYT